MQDGKVTHMEHIFVRGSRVLCALFCICFFLLRAHVFVPKCVCAYVRMCVSRQMCARLLAHLFGSPEPLRLCIPPSFKRHTMAGESRIFLERPRAVEREKRGWHSGSGCGCKGCLLLHACNCHLYSFDVVCAAFHL